ncbi:unnamed protein product [Lampetra fluviatilis]
MVHGERRTWDASPPTRLGADCSTRNVHLRRASREAAAPPRQHRFQSHSPVRDSSGALEAPGRPGLSPSTVSAVAAGSTPRPRAPRAESSRRGRCSERLSKLRAGGGASAVAPVNAEGHVHARRATGARAEPQARAQSHGQRATCVRYLNLTRLSRIRRRQQQRREDDASSTIW